MGRVNRGRSGSSDLYPPKPRGKGQELRSHGLEIAVDAERGHGGRHSPTALKQEASRKGSGGPISPSSGQSLPLTDPQPSTPRSQETSVSSQQGEERIWGVGTSRK